MPRASRLPRSPLPAIGPLVHASLPPPFETFLLKQGFHPHPGHLYTKRLTVCP